MCELFICHCPLTSHHSYLLFFFSLHFTTDPITETVGRRFNHLTRWLTMVIFCMVITTAASTYPKIRLNYGVVFTPSGRLHPSQDIWLHTVAVELPHQLQLKPLNMKCPKVEPARGDLKTKPKCRSLLALAQNLHEIRQDSVDELNVLIHNIHKWLPNTTHDFTPDSRSKRKILGFIGDLQHTFFGVATDKSVRILRDHINMLHNQSYLLNDRFNHQLSNFASFVKSSNHRFNNLRELIDTNHIALEEVTTNINEIYDYLDTNIYLTTILVKELQAHSHFYFSLENLYSAIIDLTHHSLSPFLIPIHTARSIINDISLTLKTKLPTFKLQFSHPKDLYENKNFIWTHHNNTIYITIEFPITSHPLHLQVYKVDSYPVPLNYTTTHATQLLNLPPFIAFSTDGLYFAELASDEWNQCLHTHHRPCHLPVPYQQTAYPTCTAALYNQQQDHIKTLCDFRFIYHAINPSLVLLPDHSYIVSNMSSLSVTCPSSVYTIKGCMFCIFKMPCACSIAAVHKYLPPQMANCRNTSNIGAITRLFPTNLGLLLQLYDTHQIVHISGDTYFTAPKYFKHPDFAFYSSNYSSLIAADKQEDLSLQRMAFAAQLNSSIYRHLSEPFLDKLEDSASSVFFSFSISYILPIVSIATTALNMLVCAYLFYKHRVLVAAMAALNQPNAAGGFPTLPLEIHTLFPPKPTLTTTTTASTVDCSVTPHDYVPHILLILFILTLITYLYRKFTKLTHTHTTLCFDVTNGHSCVRLSAIHLPYCPQFWHVMATSDIEKITINHYILPTVTITWNSLIISDLLSGKSHNPNLTFRINTIKALYLRKLLTHDCFIYPLALHAGYAQHLKICKPTCEECVTKPVITPKTTSEDSE